MPRATKKEIETIIANIRDLLKTSLSDDEICQRLNISKQSYLRWIRKYKFEHSLHRLLPEKLDELENDVEVKSLLEQTGLSSDELKDIFMLLNHSFHQERPKQFIFPHINTRQKYFIVRYFQNRLQLSETKSCKIIGQNRQTQQGMADRIEKEQQKIANERKIIEAIH